ncbi:phosphocholine-specific phospholipase C [Sphingobacterium chuzhouense]|uniref:phospholipase C n=1 Tax=Sphingobacterium chuzhouense TaxID=1742264 RepID=A0ABR7XLZ7_9SPHI|nr:phospholipase C, phosphocholine-specific [Sphingobacterium chuzhouense]MBD1420180.1 phospholipase C, phosphocholine-specific [Sphingobacterium chuzhouense]
MSKETRRDFIKKSALLTGVAGLSTILPQSIQRAFAINPEIGSTYLDAEHVVMLMLENRSFDHCFGTLKGVRGFNDPRALTLANGNPVWLQSNKAGHTYAPFRLNIYDTKSTWMGALPHGRHDQVDAYNEAKYDKWLDFKRSSNKKYADMPLTLGYYNREDLPFNYAMADAFTICDQNFCSAMTSTHPNRLYFWTGTIRDPRDPNTKAFIRNPDLKTGEMTWKTFPERLEENGVSWRIYQNDLGTGGGFQDEERAWVSNYNCNPLEFFPRYNVKFFDRNIKSLQRQVETLPVEIDVLEKNVFLYDIHTENYRKIREAISIKKKILADAQKEIEKFTPENFDKLSKKEKNLYYKAFSTNKQDPDFRKLTTVNNEDSENSKSFEVPKGDLFYEFRKDVNAGSLPTVSWLVAPHYFSDHPSKPMYGPWYISEILDILTKNESVWKKTIFIVTYDENDGYFDHVPPFTSPDLSKPDGGKCSRNIDPKAEYIQVEDELEMGVSKGGARGAPIGLGYRVPLLIASPWSRGGKVCSQVFDHTSSLLFLEHFVNEKFGLAIKDENISEWRRTVCGNLTAAFDPYDSSESDRIAFLKRDPFIGKIRNATNKPVPTGYKRFSTSEIEEIKRAPHQSALLPKQEEGICISSALPYELYVTGCLSNDRKQFTINMHVGKNVFGNRSAGSPFSIYASNGFRNRDGKYEKMKNWQYAVTAGNTLNDEWTIDFFENKDYHLTVYGPNGFYREFNGNQDDPEIVVECVYEKDASNPRKLTGNIQLVFQKIKNKDFNISIKDKSYGAQTINRKVRESDNQIVIDLHKSFGWYDFEIQIQGYKNYKQRYAGRVETGKRGYTDPVIGGLSNIAK